MRIWIVLVVSWIIFLANVYLTYGQTPEASLDKTKRIMELVDATGRSSPSKYYLDSLMLAERAPLILVQSPDSLFIFVPHRGCYVRRHFKGSYEERNAGGDSEQRGNGGDITMKKKGVFLPGVRPTVAQSNVMQAVK